VSIQLTRWRLSEPSVPAVQEYDSLSVYRFRYLLEEPLGKEVKLQEFAGKPLFINFWASWCVPCLAEFSSMEELMAELPGVNFVYVTMEERPAFEKYLARTNYDFRFYRQATPAPPAFAHGAIPASYLLDSEGKVLYQHVGAADWSGAGIAEMLRQRLR